MPARRRARGRRPARDRQQRRGARTLTVHRSLRRQGPLAATDLRRRRSRTECRRTARAGHHHRVRCPTPELTVRPLRSRRGCPTSNTRSAGNEKNGAAFAARRSATSRVEHRERTRSSSSVVSGRFDLTRTVIVSESSGSWVSMSRRNTTPVSPTSFEADAGRAAALCVGPLPRLDGDFDVAHGGQLRQVRHRFDRRVPRMPCGAVDRPEAQRRRPDQVDRALHLGAADPQDHVVAGGVTVLEEGPGAGDHVVGDVLAADGDGESHEARAEDREHRRHTSRASEASAAMAKIATVAVWPSIRATASARWRLRASACPLSPKRSSLTRQLPCDRCARRTARRVSEVITRRAVQEATNATGRRTSASAIDANQVIMAWSLAGHAAMPTSGGHFSVTSLTSSTCRAGSGTAEQVRSGRWHGLARSVEGSTGRVSDGASGSRSTSGASPT